MPSSSSTPFARGSWTGTVEPSKPVTALVHSFVWQKAPCTVVVLRYKRLPNNFAKMVLFLALIGLHSQLCWALVTEESAKGADHGGRPSHRCNDGSLFGEPED